MKIGPFELRRRTVEAAVAPEIKQPKDALGASGVINQSGYLQQLEYNSDLKGQAGLRVFDRMLRSDGTVQEAIEHLRAPIKNATWQVEPPENPDPVELEATAFVQQACFEWLRQPWLEHLDAALEYLDYGFAVFETSWQVVEAELRVTIPDEFDVDAVTGKRSPKVEVKPSRQFLTWKRFEPRLQQTIWQWHVEHGELTGVTQQVFKDDGFHTITIPAEQLLVLTNKLRGDDFTGRSVLRAAYKAWVMKELVEKVAGVAVERHGVAIPIAYPPEQTKDDDAVVGRLEKILGNLRAGAFSYVVSPGPKQTGTQQGYLFELLSPGGTVPDFSTLLNFHRAEIKAAVLARFAELGHGATGARATGDVQSIVWYAALHAVARYLEAVHQPKIEQLVDANYPGISRYPKLRAYDIESRNLAEFAEAISRLVAGGAVNADESFRAFVRKSIDAPEEDEVDDTEETDAVPNANLDDQGRPIEPENSPMPPMPAPAPKADAKAKPDQLQLPIKET